MKKHKGGVFPIKKIALLLIFFLSFLNVKIHAADNIPTALIICSYNSGNEWEQSVLRGINDYFKTDANINLKYEFLDVSSFTDNEYYADTLNLLELKYNKDNIHFIITVDDEAFEFVRANLFNKNCFMYKHKIFFIGVNKRLNLNSDEKDYISGLKDNQSAYKSINLITEALPNTSDIYIALDENTYSKAIVNSIEYNKKLINKQQVNLNYIKSNYLSDIIENIKYIDSTTSAILCCGSFYTEDSKVINSTILINKIKEKTNSPIFTTLYNYLENGAVGGYINSGPNIGYKAAQYSYDIINGNDNSMVIYDYNGLSDKCIMDFKLIRKYNINPRLLPKDTIYINKGRFSLTVSKPAAALIWFSIILCLMLLLLFVISYIDNNRRKKVSLLQLSASKEREKIKTDFLIIMSHELRTPLNIILNTSKLLLNKCENNECNPEFCCKRLVYIGNNANRLLRSVNNSIDVAKLDSNVYDITYSMINIVELIDNIVDLTAQYASDYNVDIIFDPQKEEIFTATDIEKIEKIVLNLISNSIKNIPSRGTIYISCRDDDNNIYLTIEDDGRGMTDKVKTHIFDKFFHSPFSGLSRSAEGSGIGLYIVKKFIDILDGTISVESTLGVGTTFYITLPKREVDKVDTDKVVSGIDRIKYLIKLEFSEINKRK